MSRITRSDGKSSTEEYTEEGSGPSVDDGTGGVGTGVGDTDTGFFEQDLTIPDAESTGINTSDGSPFDEYADLKATDEGFKFLECDPLEQPQDVEKCPICRPNPFAYVPDYRMMEHGDPFFDGKTCTQNIVLTFDPPANNIVDTPSSFASDSMLTSNLRPEATNKIESTGPTVAQLKSKSFRDEQKEIGLRMLMAYFNKAETVTAFVYKRQPAKERVAQGIIGGAAIAGASIAGLGLLVGGTLGAAAALGYAASLPKKAGYDLEQEKINVLTDETHGLLRYAKFEYHIPIQLKARTRVLISIPVEQFNRVPEAIITEPETEFETNLEVSFKGRDFIPMSKRVLRAFKVYNNELKRWREFDGGKIVETDSRKNSKLDLKSEADKITSFTNELREMLEELGFGFDPFQVKKIPEKVVIKFKLENKKYSIRQILVNLPGCPVVKIGPSGKYARLFKKYTDRSPLGRSRTLYYIGALPEIDLALTARTPTPWLEVVTKFTYPAVEIKYGTNANTMYNDPTLFGCLVNSAFADDRVDDFFNEIGDLTLDIGAAVEERFAQNSCLDRPELLKRLSDLEQYDKVFSSESKRVAEEVKRKLRLDDPVIEVLFESLFPAATHYGTLTPEQKEDFKKDSLLKSFKNYDDGKKGFFDRLNSKLDRCGWITLIMKAIDCVAQGLTGDDATKALAEAAFNSMEDAALTRTFLGLSPETQLKIINTLERDFSGLPAPYSTAPLGGAYNPGNYTGAGFSVSPLSKAEKGQIRDSITAPDVPDAPAFPEGFSLPYAPAVNIVNPAVGLPSERELEQDAIREARQDAREGTPDAEFRTNDVGSGGTYGNALAGFNKEAHDALRDVMLRETGADELLDAMNRLPGAPIISQLFKNVPCKQAKLIFSEPKLDSFLQTVEFDFCQWTSDMTVPVFKIADIFDIFLRLLEAMKDAIIDTAIAIVLQALKLILEKTFSLACDALALLGANLLDLTNGNNHFRDLLKENMCPDASQEDMNDTIKNLFAALGDPDQDCLERLTNSEMGDFIDDISLMLTQGQICQLLQGTPNEETLKLAMEVAQTSNSECIKDIFSDPNAFRDFFNSLAPFIPNLQELCDSLIPNASDLQVYPCAPETAEKIEDLRCDLLAQKGLTTEECREMLDDLKDKAIKDLADLADMMQNGIYNNMPPIDSTDDCPADGFFPSENPLQNALEDNISKAMMETVEKAHLRDLWGNINKRTGQGGFLNALLSDTKGRPYKQHNWYVEHFGAPLAADFDFFDYHCDNVITRPEDSPGVNTKKPINVFGEDLEGSEGGKSARQSFGAGFSSGGYPPTVAAYLSKKFRKMKDNITFKTTTKPKGFDNVTDALEEFERVQRVNQKRIAERSKYIEAWIREYEVEDRFQSKRSVLASDLRAGITKKIFVAEFARDEDKASSTREARKINPKNSPEDLAREVLLGKQVLGGVGVPGERGVPSRTGTKGEVFIDFYAGKHKLLDLPDTSSADIVLKYEAFPSYKDDLEVPFEFSIEYDYNLIDLETQRLAEDNRYQVKVSETHRVSKPKQLTKKEIRQQGNEILAQSIYQPGATEYTFTRYQFEVKSTPPGDVTEYLDSLTERTTGEALTRPPGETLGDSFEAQALYNFFRRALLDASGDVVTASRIIDSQRTGREFKDYFVKKQNDYGGKTLFDNLSSGFLERISTIIATGNPSKGFKNKDDDDLSNREEKTADKMDLEKISRAFQFGYNPDREARIITLDPFKYGGPAARNNPESVPPPFYVKERRYKGWLDLCDTLVPEVAGCDPQSKAIYNLEDLTDMISKLKSDLKDDRRLEFDPLCSHEAPFDKIFTTFDAANVEAAMRAVIRIYVLDVFLRTVPAFSAFAITEDNYDDLMTAFVVERIKDGLFLDGAKRTGIGDETYYYRFIEQAVNNTKRKLDAEIIQISDLSDEEQLAFKRISEDIYSFYEEYEGEYEILSDAAIRGKGIFDSFFSTSAAARAVGVGAGSNRFNKRVAKIAKDRAFIDVISRNEKEALVFLRRYVREEFDYIRERFSDAVPPVVNNVNNLMALSPDWVRGAVDDEGPYNVMSDPNDPTDYVFEAEDEDNWPFVLEKYIRIKEKEDPSVDVSRAENLYDIVNIDEWEDYVKAKKAEGLRGDISELWESWSFGLRLSYQIRKKDNSVFEDIINTIDDETIMNTKSYKVVDRAGKTRYVIPIASGELEIPDQRYDLFDASTYDVYCLILEMQKTPEFRTMFKYIFPLPRFISLLAMYSTLGFTASIGNSGYPKEGGDVWEHPGGKPHKKFRKWNHSPTKSFERSRQAARRVFESFYEASQAIDFDMSSDRDPKNSADSLRELLRPKINFEDGLRWWERGLQVKGNPYNADGDECE